VSEIALRPAHADDAEFLFALMKVSLGPYVIETFGPWDDSAQRTRFFASLVLERHQIVEHNGECIGCLSVAREPELLRLNRVFLLPSHQGRGIGSRLVADLIREADAAKLPIRLRVLRVNPARRLYERLGFRVFDRSETHFLMERSAALSQTPR